MASRRTPLLLLALLLVVGVVALSRSLFFGATEDALARTVDTPASLPEPAGELARPGVPEPSRERSEVAAPPEPTAETEQAVAASARSFSVEGELVLVEPDGSERRDLGGTMDLILWRGNSGSHVSVAIEGGRWRAELVADVDGTFGQRTGRRVAHFGDSADVESASIAPTAPRLEGGPVVLDDPKQRFAFGDTGVVVRVRRVPVIRLFVEDAQTGVGLGGLTVLRIDDWKRDDNAHPGDLAGARTLAEGAASPIELAPVQRDAERGVGQCFVHAPGYAWTKVEVDFSRGGERRVRLGPGGDLELTLAGGGTPADLCLRVRRSGETSRPFCEAALARALRGEPLVLRGLPPGTFDLTAEVGDWFSDPLVLASTAVDVRAGELARATLTLEAAPELLLAPLSGRLILPEEWAIEWPMVVLELLDTPLDGTDGRHRFHREDLRAEGGGIFAFDAGEVQTGRYELSLFDLESAVVITLGPGGLRDAVLEVPPPVELTVFVRDETTGGVADVRQLFWNCGRPEGVTGGGLKSAERAPGEERFRLRLPRCEVDLRTRSESFSSAQASVFAEDGLEVVLDVRPAAAVLVLLRDGDTPIPWPDGSLFGGVESVADTGRQSVGGGRDGGLWFTVTEPGLYRVKIPELEGYEPHAPVEVDALEGETAEVIVQLERVP